MAAASAYEEMGDYLSPDIDLETDLGAADMGDVVRSLGASLAAVEDLEQTALRLSDAELGDLPEVVEGRRLLLDSVTRLYEKVAPYIGEEREGGYPYGWGPAVSAAPLSSSSLRQARSEFRPLPCSAVSRKLPIVIKHIRYGERGAPYYLGDEVDEEGREKRIYLKEYQREQLLNGELVGFAGPIPESIGGYKKSRTAVLCQDR